MKLADIEVGREYRTSRHTRDYLWDRERVRVLEVGVDNPRGGQRMVRVQPLDQDTGEEKRSAKLIPSRHVREPWDDYDARVAAQEERRRKAREEWLTVAEPIARAMDLAGVPVPTPAFWGRRQEPGWLATLDQESAVLAGQVNIPRLNLEQARALADAMYHGPRPLQALAALQDQEPSMALFWDTRGEQWVCSLQWGSEAEDSPMVGAEAVGSGATPEAAVEAAVGQVHGRVAEAQADADEGDPPRW